MENFLETVGKAVEVASATLGESTIPAVSGESFAAVDNLVGITREASRLTFVRESLRAMRADELLKLSADEFAKLADEEGEVKEKYIVSHQEESFLKFLLRTFILDPIKDSLN